jgi:hypothetical protein
MALFLKNFLSFLGLTHIFGLTFSIQDLPTLNPEANLKEGCHETKQPHDIA